MRQMCPRLHLKSACILIGCAVIFANAIPSFSQGTAQPFRYVIPRFNANAGSEFVISNLSSRLVTPEISIFESSTESADIFLPIPAGSQQRFTHASFGLTTLNGTVVISSSAALSVAATVADTAGNIETVQPAAGASTLIVPFGPATSGNMVVTIFSVQSIPTTTLIAAIGADGSTIGSVQRIIPAFGSVTENVNALVPPTAFGQPRDISHVVVRALTNIFGGDRLLYAQATVTGFSASTEGLIGQHFDPGIVNGIASSTGVTKTTVPFFVQGGDYLTMLQVISTSGVPASVTLTALAEDGSVIDSAAVSVPANGSVRRNIQNLFNLGGTLRTGSITADSSTPVLAVAALASVGGNGFAVMPATEPANTNFAFRTRAANPQSYTGFVFRNAGASAATVTLLNIPDDGSGVSSEIVTIGPSALLSRSLLEVLAEARTSGFVYVSSDVPIFAQAIEGRNDNTMLGNLPPMHSQPDYVPPPATKFLITGTVRHNGSLFAGVSIQLSGPKVASTVTDEAGNYQFSNVPPGQYSVSAGKAGYTFSPSSSSVTITSASKRENNFDATLVTPVITVLVPTGVVAGSSATDIVVAGSPIIATSEIVFDGSPVLSVITTAGVPVTLVGATGGISIVLQPQTVLRGNLSAALLATPREATVVIRNSGPGGSVDSEPKLFGVGSPAPVISSVSGVPSPLIAGNSGFTMTVVGTGFTPGTVVVFNGTQLATTFISETQLEAAVTAAVLADPGVQRLSVLKPAPTIGPSNELTVTIASPAPEVTSISPNTVEARLTETAPPIAITVNGFNFVKKSVVQIDGKDVPTDFVSGTQLVGKIPQLLAETARSALISVKNPDPVSPEFHFDTKVPLLLNNPVPTVTSMDASVLTYDPTPRFLGDEPTYVAFVAIRGTNFAKNELLRYLTGTPCQDKTGLFTGERISSTLVIGQITIACTGQYRFGATNLQPGGGVSQLISFNVSQYTAPAPLSVTGMSPAAINAGSPEFDLTITGTRFDSGAYVNFGTAVLIPKSVTATSITVTVPSFLVRNPAVIPVSVTNTNILGNSNRILFTVN